jgi:hypothetical protein
MNLSAGRGGWRAERWWASSGIVFVALFAIGLGLADVLASSPYPSFAADDFEIVSYFGDSRLQVRALSVSHSLAAMALVVFAVHVASVVRRGDEAAERPAALVLVSGVMAGAFLLLSALLFWVLTLAVTTAGAELVRVLLAFSYLAGGPPGLLLPLTLFVGASSRAAVRTRLLPGWLTRAGEAFAVAGMLCTFVMLDRVIGLESPVWRLVLLPTVTLGVMWVLATSVLLARRARDSA